MKLEEIQKHIEKFYGNRYKIENGYIQTRAMESANKFLFGSAHGKNIYNSLNTIDCMKLEQILEKADKIYPALETLSKYIDLAEIDIVNRESNGDVTIFFQHHYPFKLNCFPHRRKMIKTIDGMNKFLLGTVIEFTKDNTVIDHTNLL